MQSLHPFDLNLARSARRSLRVQNGRATATWPDGRTGESESSVLVLFAARRRRPAPRPDDDQHRVPHLPNPLRLSKPRPSMPIGDDNDVQPARLPPPSPPPSSLSSTPAAGAPDMSRLPTNLLRDALAAVLHPSTPSPFQLVFSSHPAWPRPPLSSSSATAAAPALSKRELRISCLDSSFNPPTRAHQALATAAYPGPAGQAQGEAGDYDAHLLLLSVKNVDKVLKTGDADYECVSSLLRAPAPAPRSRLLQPLR